MGVRLFVCLRSKLAQNEGGDCQNDEQDSDNHQQSLEVRANDRHLLLVAECVDAPTRGDGCRGHRLATGGFDFSLDCPAALHLFGTPCLVGLQLRTIELCSRSRLCWLTHVDETILWIKMSVRFNGSV